MKIDIKNQLLNARRKLGLAEREPPASLCLLDVRPLRRVALVTMLGIEPAEMGTVVDNARRTMALYKHLIFLTDSVDFSELRKRKVIFEYWPSPEESWKKSPDLDWPEYLLAKRDLVYQKWGINVEVAFGCRIDERIAAATEFRSAVI